MSDRVHTAFLGVTGTGKTHECKRRVAELVAQGARVLSISPVDEWSRTSPERQGPLREAMTFAEFKADPGKLFEKKLSLSLYGFDPLKPQQGAAAVRLVARLQSRFRLETGRTPPSLVLVLDECGPYARHCADVLEGLATVGGQHLGVTVWAIAQRPALIPKTLRSQCKRFVLWHLSEDSDVEAVVERMRDDSLKARLPELPDTYAPGVVGFIELSPSSSAKPTAASSAAQASPPAAHLPPSPPANPKQKAGAT